MDNFAPVYIGTLNRYEHFSRAVESLRQNSHASDTCLFVGLDHPTKESHIEGYQKICGYLDSLKGFKDLVVFRRDNNLGAIRNFQDGKARLFEKHDRIIVSEDDNYFSPNFLSYVNEGLERFANEKMVFAVCGHNYPINLEGLYDGNHYVWQGCSVWGYGIWRDRYQSMKCAQEDFAVQLRNIGKVIRAYRIAPHYVGSMLAKARSSIEFDPFSDAAINLHLREHGQYCVFPTLSKVRNFGHDGSGLRSGIISGESPFATQPIDTTASFSYVCGEKQFFNNPVINKTLFRYFYRGRVQTLKTVWRLIRFYLREVRK